MWQTAEQLQAQTRPVHSMREYRGVPTSRLTRRLGLTKYDHLTAPWLGICEPPTQVTISLHTHMGARAVPVVKEGNKVTLGEVIAVPPEESMGVPVHASISGTVTSVGDQIEIQRIGK